MGDALCCNRCQPQNYRTTSSARNSYPVSTIAGDRGFIVGFPLCFLGIMAFYQAGPLPKELKSSGAPFSGNFFLHAGVAFRLFLLALLPSVSWLIIPWEYRGRSRPSNPGRLYREPGGYHYRVGAGVPTAAGELCTTRIGLITPPPPYLPEVCLCGYSIRSCCYYSFSGLDEPDHRSASLILFYELISVFPYGEKTRIVRIKKNGASR